MRVFAVAHRLDQLAAKARRVGVVIRSSLATRSRSLHRRPPCARPGRPGPAAARQWSRRSPGRRPEPPGRRRSRCRRRRSRGWPPTIAGPRGRCSPPPSRSPRRARRSARTGRGSHRSMPPMPLGHGGGVVRGASRTPSRPPHDRVQGLHPAVHHLREAGELGDVLHRQSGVGDGLARAAVETSSTPSAASALAASTSPVLSETLISARFSGARSGAGRKFGAHGILLWSRVGDAQARGYVSPRSRGHPPQVPVRGVGRD